MRKWFYSQSKILQVIMLLVPVVNWVTELAVRWSKALETKNLLDIVIAVLVTIPSGVIIGWLDAIWVLLFDKILLG